MDGKLGKDLPGTHRSVKFGTSESQSPKISRYADDGCLEDLDMTDFRRF